MTEYSPPYWKPFFLFAITHAIVVVGLYHSLHFAAQVFGAALFILCLPIVFIIYFVLGNYLILNDPLSVALLFCINSLTYAAILWTPFYLLERKKYRAQHPPEA